MLSALRTRGILARAHKLRRIVNHCPDLSTATTDVHVLRRQVSKAKRIFLSSVENGSVEALAQIYGHDARAKKYGPRRTKVKLEPDASRECMIELKSLIDASGAKVFLVSGTLLGCVRENRLLAHDYDIDLGLDVEDPRGAALFKAFEAHPDFKLRKMIGITNEIGLLNEWAQPHIGKPWLVKYMYKGMIPVDVFMHINFRGEAFHGSKRNLWVNSQFELTRLPLYGLDFFAPVDTDRYLTENYGDWRTPVKGFQCTTDTPNARVMHTVSAAKSLMKWYIMFNWRNDRARQKIVLDRLRQCFD